MPDNLLALGESHHQALTNMATDNEDIILKWIAVLRRCDMLCSDRNKSIECLEIQEIENAGKQLRAHIRFSNILNPYEGNERFDRLGPGVDYILKGARADAKIARSNKTFFKFLNALVICVESYAKHKGMRFEDVEFGKAFIDPDDNVIVLEFA